MTKMGACLAALLPRGQRSSSFPTSEKKPQSSSSPSTAPTFTRYQLKAIHALKNIGKKFGPPVEDWVLPTSDDPDVELLVFPLLTFEGYLGDGGKGAETEVTTKVKEQLQAASQKQVARDKAKRDKHGRVTSFKPLGPDDIVEASKLPFWPGEYDCSASEDSSEGKSEDLGERMVGQREVSSARRRLTASPALTSSPCSPSQLCLKRYIESKIDNGSWPPDWDNVEAEVRLMEIRCSSMMTTSSSRSERSKRARP